MFRRMMVVVVVWSWWIGWAWAGPSDQWQNRIKALAGTGAVLAVDRRGGEVVSIHPDQPLVPASTLKVVTAAAAFSILTPDYRFATDFFQTSAGDLVIVGRGDPYLISEEVDGIAKALGDRGLTRVRDLVLDNRFFVPGLVLDGTERSLNPYDAYNGALCVNFNTIFVQIAANGQIESAESQTPLTPTAKRLAQESRRKGRVRLNLAQHPDICLRYAGELFQAFLVKNGVAVEGRIREARAGESSGATLFHRHHSRKNLAELVTELMKYSNNFMTNQIFLTMGAERFGPPATPDKARQAVAQYLAAQKIPGFHMEEGSGLSRKTRITARQMMAVLKAFGPYQDLLPEEDGIPLKTGTLSDVKSLVGYLPGPTVPAGAFVILLNGDRFSGRTRMDILELLEQNIR